MSHEPLPRDFYDRDTVQVARDLLGCRIYRHVGERLYVARVVETEAYCGPHDLACHASKGLTPRTEPMYGPPGHAYVYFIYGLHHCLNVVTEGPGIGSAVLIRALEPIGGFAEATRTDGPARLTKALSIDRAQNKLDLTSGTDLWFAGPERPAGEISTGKRIGVDYAGEWAERPWRFWLHSPCVSVQPRRRRSAVLEGTPTRPTGGEGTRGL
ncbi:DNA-3-methyladenine glycosylase [Vulgatibacter sp.]|uniref:DNA-3-methyladenine glycosylase n=1 Tax=Vulgatibacter sp. TaxID=1971226 RepID=UPI003565E369